MCWVTKVISTLRLSMEQLLNSSEAMKRMAASNVLIVGMKGLGVEIGAFAIHQDLEQKLTTIQPRMSSLLVSNR